MNVENPRLRLVLGTQWKVIVVVLGVVALAAFGAAAATYGDQPTARDTVDVNEQSIVTDTTERARVVRDDSLWPNGTVLRDKPVYIRNATPALRTTARTEVAGADDARIRHVWRVTILVTTGEETFYSESRTIANETHRGTTAKTTATIDSREIAGRVGNVSEKARGAGAVSVVLSLRVDYRTDPGAESGYSGTETYSGPIELGGETYAVAGDLGGRADHSTSQVREVAQPRDWGAIAGMALLGVLALALGGAVVTVDPQEIDVEGARIDLHRTRYEEWISPGVIPMGVSQQFVELETIEDVVDVAIDTNERVVWDRRRDLYAVISENLVYYFSPSGSWMESAFRPMRMGGDGSDLGRDDGDGPFGGGPDDREGPPGPPGGPGGEAFGFPEGDESPFDGGDGGTVEGEAGPFGAPPGGDAAGGSPFEGAGQVGEDGNPFGEDAAGDDSPFGDATSGEPDGSGDDDGDPSDT